MSFVIYILWLYEISHTVCWDLRFILVMYYDTCDMTILEFSVDEMLWYYSAASFEKVIYACLRFIEDVTSKFFIWLYHLCVLSL